MKIIIRDEGNKKKEIADTNRPVILQFDSKEIEICEGTFGDFNIRHSVGRIYITPNVSNSIDIAVED